MYPTLRKPSRKTSNVTKNLVDDLVLFLDLKQRKGPTVIIKCPSPYACDYVHHRMHVTMQCNDYKIILTNTIPQHYVDINNKY